VHDLRRGRQPGPALERRVMAYITQQIAGLPDTPARRRAIRRAQLGARLAAAEGEVRQ
jgi:hypothetical protein